MSERTFKTHFLYFPHLQQSPCSRGWAVQPDLVVVCLVGSVCAPPSIIHLILSYTGCFFTFPSQSVWASCLLHPRNNVHWGCYSGKGDRIVSSSVYSGVRTLFIKRVVVLSANWNHWCAAALDLSPPPELCPRTAAVLVAICCRDDHRGSSWPYDKLTLALTGEAFLLMHTGTLTCRSTLFDREAQIQTRSDNARTQTVLVHLALPCHCTAQVGVSQHSRVHRLSCLVIGSRLPQRCAHW